MCIRISGRERETPCKKRIPNQDKIVLTLADAPIRTFNNIFGLPKLADGLIAVTASRSPAPTEATALLFVRTSFCMSAREPALMAASEGLKRSLVDVLRTRSNDGTEPFFGMPADDITLVSIRLVVIIGSLKEKNPYPDDET